jgi:hypothetical protein
MSKSPVLAVLLLCACHDPGSDTLAAARLQVEALQKAGTPVQSRDYDAVLKTLDAISDSSRAKGDAKALVKTITDARAKVPEPAVPHALSHEEALTDLRAECDRLAEQQKSLQGEARARKQELLDACRRRLADLEATP